MATVPQTKHSTAETEKPANKTRLLFVDNIRWSLIVLVICHHAAVTYSHVGGWYYNDGPKPPLGTALLFATFETFNQAYFMGILFLFAAYFAAPAFDSKGTGRFLRDRAIRLGIPSLFFMLVIHPVTVYWLLRTFDDPSIPSLATAYPRFLASGRVFGATGPMWFAVALLIFCVIYAAVRLISPHPPSKSTRVPTHRSVIAFILLMGTCTFLIRIVQPIGTNILNMQMCYFSQYILLFIAGILAYRGDWLQQIPKALGMLWFRLALTVGVVSWFVILATSGATHGDTQRLLGGFHWQSAAFSFWESFFCLGMCLGLIVLFRERWNSQSRFSQWMSQNSFSAYVFHTPFLVGVTLALKGLPASPFEKFILASVIAAPVTFVLGGMIRTYVPGLRRIL